MYKLGLAGTLLAIVGVSFAASPAIVLQKQLQKLKTFQADFSQSMQQGEQQIQQKGTVVIAKPGRFRWQVLKPHQQLYVSNGHKIWQYDKLLQQVTVRQLSSGLSATPIMLLTGTKPLASLYHVKSAGPGAFILTPRQPGSVMKSITLYFKQHQLAGMSLQNSLHQTTHIQFSDVRYNQKIKPGLFVFTAPKGVDVLNVSS